MPSDEYTTVARGPLKLKGGAGVTKKKKKKDKAKTDLEKNLSTGGEDGGRDSSERALAQTGKEGSPGTGTDKGEGTPPAELQRDDGPSASAAEDDYKTEAERRFAEIKRKRVRDFFFPSLIASSLLLRPLSRKGEVGLDAVTEPGRNNVRR